MIGRLQNGILQMLLPYTISTCSILYIHIYLNTVVFWFFGEIHFGIDCGTRDSGSDVAPTNTNCLIVWHAPNPKPQRIQTLQHTKPQTL